MAREMVKMVLILALLRKEKLKKYTLENGVQITNMVLADKIMLDLGSTMATGIMAKNMEKEL